ncbi:hypothetical protein [Acrocarpospora catenulata]|uniref:hypothetical protein n=1 Tax=Acrocarpospora catenulata TaxID=2836182 RepID=UPI001BD9D6D7|nr:hypothetical protein [Acrocarpospora catenulata]
MAVPLPATAHPFGDPSTARVGAQGSRVTIVWLAAADDWVALGRRLGAFEDPAAGVDTSLTGEQKLARSTAVRDYLLSKVGVTQAGRPCAGELAPLEQILDQGARFSFACAEPVVDVDVRISLLTDMHEAYRTALTAEAPATPAQAMLTATTDTQRLRFDSATGGLSLAVPAVALVGVLGALGLFLVRHRKAGAGA